MPWIVKHIQQGECHHVQHHINTVIKKKREEVLHKSRELEQLFDELEEKNREREKGKKNPSKCQSDVSKCRQNNMNPWRLAKCKGKHETNYMSMWKIYYGKHYQRKHNCKVANRN